ncbi:tryptophan 2,3-dioxygenase family protein [Bailinhaonella thermotolerans]|uniref:Tryptophan 2,3-dioxygenase n=1 Tax=Bailinhaonella thermotolerans TaxID=1070861 RepID=A0A3A4AD17_9ACTN|nr:hypothetical protein D5H75_25780 [Bailinhaonella thermotolerans]
MPADLSPPGVSPPGPSYRSYLALERILAAQRPVTPREDPGIWAAERFFIVCHQASELWASQILVDLEEAGRLAGFGDWEAASAVVLRAAATAGLLSRTLAHLGRLPAESFLAFRGALEGASGAESEQFRGLLRGRRHGPVRRLRAGLRAALPAAGEGAPHRPPDCGHAVCACDAALEAYLGAITAWRGLHAKVAYRFIGDRPGTGGTEGVGHLLRRIVADAGEEGDDLGPPPEPELAEHAGDV